MLCSWLPNLTALRHTFGTEKDVTAARDARLGRELRQIVLKAGTQFARIVGLAMIIRIPQEWKPAKGMLLNFKEKDPNM